MDGKWESELAALENEDFLVNGDEDERLAKLRESLYRTRMTGFIAPFEMRRCIQRLEAVERKLASIRRNGASGSGDRVKFRFKSLESLLKSRLKEPQAQEDNFIIEESQRGSSPPVNLIAADIHFENLDLEVLYRQEERNSKLSSVIISNVKNSRISLLLPMSSVFIRNADSCTIVLIAVQGPIFIDNARDCTLAFASHQLRIHSAVNSTFSVQTKSNPIIENSSNLSFYPLKVALDETVIHLLKEKCGLSRLDHSKNMWNKVQDFQWPRLDVPSPHWCVAPMEARFPIVPIQK